MSIRITTQDRFDDHEIAQTLGLVRGNTIRARHIGKDILALFRMLVGGEIGEYTKMLGESREQAIDRMVAEAEQLGADAIVCMRFSTSAVAQGAAELLAYGTAVKLRD
ncbi:MAG: YbjQ family protein [Caldilineae bacterium]|nr:YbjQ family protein [Chloroflexota bacterium]MCB9176993.1 YbjQ family protein [Caldilineae bacterium]